MNIIDFEQAKKTSLKRYAVMSDKAVSKQNSSHYFVDKFETILTDFEKQNDLLALENLTHFLSELDKHLDEAERLKASAEMLETILLKAKVNQE